MKTADGEPEFPGTIITGYKSYISHGASSMILG
jgi:hypothetical protein